MSEGSLIILTSIACTGLFVLGTPIFLVIGFWVIGVSLAIDFTLANLGVTLYEGLNFYGLLALPLFVLTGDLMKGSGLARRLADFAHALLGRIHGGLGMASLGACGLFAAISGSNSATTATIGSIMQPEMKRAGYDERFAAATVAAGGTVGIIIPPSIIFIVYGFLLNISVSDLFIGGLLPGILMVLAMQAVCCLTCMRYGWGRGESWSPRLILASGFGAWLGFFCIGLVLWGIYSGIFSPTEAAGVIVGVTLIAGLAMSPIHRSAASRRRRRQAERGDSAEASSSASGHAALREGLSAGEILAAPGFSLRGIPDLVLRSGLITGLLAPLIAVSVVMQQLLSLIGAGDAVESFITGMGGYYAVLFASMAVVLAAGTILESLPNTIILAPILAPIAAASGVDPIHFAVVFLVGDAIGFITPPYGLNLYVASGITGIPYFRLLPYVMPYLLALLAVWAIIALVPDLSTILLLHEGAGVYQQ